jgi:hypothetical protein
MSDAVSSKRHAACLLFLTPLSILFAPLAAQACSGSLHVELRDPGVYALDYAEIVARQPLLGDCMSDQLSLRTAGKEVPIRIVDGDDGRFSDGDRIEWVGKSLHGPMSWFNAYSVNNVYLLSASSGSHDRLRDERSSAGTAANLKRILHLEQENLMIRLDQTQQQPGEEPDVWQWSKLTQADPVPFSTTFDLPDLASRSASVTARVNFRGISSIHLPAGDKHQAFQEHVVELALNGHPVKRMTWNGRDEFEQELAIPASALKEKSNELVLSIPRRQLPWNDSQLAVDVVMFNWIELDYAIDGDLGPDSLPFQTGGTAAQSVQLRWHGEGEAPALYGDDGIRRPPVSLGDGRFRYAAAAPGVILYPANRFVRPLSLRALNTVDWHAPAQGFDYLIVSHASLIDAVSPLAEFHRKRGMKVAVIDINDVYDEFNGGITHPQAVRNLVDYATRNWPLPHPRFLLLVGDASFDIRHDTYDDLAYAKFANSPQELVPGHFSGIPATSYDDASKRMGSRNLIPTWQYPSSEGQSASDNWFGAIDGDDYHPVVAVGRFPVVEPAEVTAIVDKTIDYMSRPHAGSWRRDVMFITDESEQFKQASDEIASTIGKQGFLADKIYASPKEADNLAHKSAIKDGLNDGQLLVHFIGHGGRYIWRTGPPDLRKNHDLFTLDDVSSLSNGDRLPMVLSMTCYSAPFDNPTEDSIGERFLREADKGAIAVFAASWRNTPSTKFSENLVRELLVPGATIGEGIVRAKRSIEDRTLVEMYNLLGDPAVVLKRPQGTIRLQVDADLWNPAIVAALPDPGFMGQVTLDVTDAAGTLLTTRHYQAKGSVFRLPIPKLDDGDLIRYANIYATDPRTGRDASGGLRIDIKRARQKSPFRWPDWMRAAPKPIAPDTLMRGDFEESAQDDDPA